MSLFPDVVAVIRRKDGYLRLEFPNGNMSQVPEIDGLDALFKNAIEFATRVTLDTWMKPPVSSE